MPTTLVRTAAAFMALGAAAAVAAFALPSSCGIEGAYFDRSVEAPRAVGNVFLFGEGVCWTPDVLLGAAAAFAISAAVLAVLAWRLSRRAES
jgi:hypothetical protein